MENCCASANNWAVYGFRHRTLHMTSDITEGSHIYIGPDHREAIVQDITTPFNASLKQGVILEVTVHWVNGGNANVQFLKSNANNDVIKVKIEESYSNWGLKGHTRNNHYPKRVFKTQTTNEKLIPFL